MSGASEGRLMTRVEKTQNSRRPLYVEIELATHRKTSTASTPIIAKVIMVVLVCVTSYGEKGTADAIRHVPGSSEIAAD